MDMDKQREENAELSPDEMEAIRQAQASLAISGMYLTDAELNEVKKMMRMSEEEYQRHIKAYAKKLLDQVDHAEQTGATRSSQ